MSSVGRKDLLDSWHTGICLGISRLKDLRRFLYVPCWNNFDCEIEKVKLQVHGNQMPPTYIVRAQIALAFENCLVARVSRPLLTAKDRCDLTRWT